MTFDPDDIEWRILAKLPDGKQLCGESRWLVRALVEALADMQRDQDDAETKTHEDAMDSISDPYGSGE